MLHRLFASLFFLVLTIGAPQALAFSDVYVFGDSLSDSGAFGHIAEGAFCPSMPYEGCRFSNGPTWAEIFAEDLGNSADTAYAPAGGTNYAIGGERSDELIGPGATMDAVSGIGQIPLFDLNNGGVADSSALYVIWAGGNNFLQNDPAGTYDPAASAADIIQAVADLSVLGATEFLVANLPIADVWAFTFNAALTTGLGELGAANPGLNITEFDTLSVLTAATLNPAAFGLTNVTDPCFDSSVPSLCGNPDQYLFWDAVHPTARGHEILASAALAIIPEPNTALLLGLGLSLIAAQRRERV